jgi:hypothetical protein
MGNTLSHSHFRQTLNQSDLDHSMSGVVDHMEVLGTRADTQSFLSIKNNRYAQKQSTKQHKHMSSKITDISNSMAYYERSGSANEFTLQGKANSNYENYMNMYNSSG